MKKIIQCVPNFSEGRDKSIIDKILLSAKEASAAHIVDFTSDVDHNRSVLTLVGTPEQIILSILSAAETAVDLIDLNIHSGGHPRIGAIDVVPLVPLENITMEETIEVSKELASLIWEKLNVPVYLYEFSAQNHERKNLAKIRKGGFEFLRDNGLVDERSPDFGDNKVHPTAGVVAVGARNPLIAFNVNLNSDDITIANKIASEIRHLRDSGQEMHGVKAIGVFLESRNIAQVSLNITDTNKITIYRVYEYINKRAKELGSSVLESELIGALRTQALIDSMNELMNIKGLNAGKILDKYL
ncbi:MAG: glutamate formimidoyltransferase [Armatimonadota bacterium]